jgi:hypothetical protein
MAGSMEEGGADSYTGAVGGCKVGGGLIGGGVEGGGIEGGGVNGVTEGGGIDGKEPSFFFFSSSSSFLSYSYDILISLLFNKIKNILCNF